MDAANDNAPPPPLAPIVGFVRDEVVTITDPGWRAAPKPWTDETREG